MTNVPAGNQTKFFGQKVSRPGINVLNATDSELIYKNDYTTTLYYNQSGVPTVLLGKRLLTGEQGLFVSQEGVDVTQATNNELIFNSNSNTLQVVDNGQVSVPAVGTSSTQTVSYSHNLDYIPMIIAFYEYQSNSYVQLPFTSFASGSMSPQWNVQVSYVDKNTVTFAVQTASSSSFAATNIYFVLLQSPAITID